MIVAQLVELSIPIPEVCGSIPVIGKNLYWKDEKRKKRPGMAQIKKQTNWCNINSSKDLETRSKNPTRKVHLVKFHKHLLFFKNEPFTASFSLFSSFQYSWQENVQYKFLQMTWFKPRTSGTGIDHSTNWVTTTAPKHLIFWQMLKDHFVRKRCLNVCKKWRGKLI